MGFLDEIKNKMHLGGQQGYDQGYGQDDDYGYDDGCDDGYQGNGYSGASGEGFYTQDEPSNGLLGQTRRGEAESVAVYTRSGQLVGDDSRQPRRITRLRARRTVLRAVIVLVPMTRRRATREHPRPCRRCACACTERCLGLCEQYHQRHTAAAGLCPAPREL